MGDWDSVTVIRKHRPNAADSRSESAVNAARRSGAAVDSTKKSAGNVNKIGIDAGKASKIDRETEDFSVERVGLGLAKTIQQARQAKNLTQKELATKLNEKPSVINDYESGRAPNPNQQLLSKMERALGVKLRGKDLGAPLGGPKKK